MNWIRKVWCDKYQDWCEKHKNSICQEYETTGGCVFARLIFWEINERRNSNKKEEVGNED